jgi:hypothetical protein
MLDPVRELKIRAEILHTRVGEGDVGALARLRSLVELRRADGVALAALAQDIRRKHCLAVVARECGFGGWEHALRAFDGDPGETDLGTLLYGREPGASSGLHVWFTRREYDEARALLGAAPHAPGERRFLLAYKRDLFLADAPFVARLGMDPGAPEWAAIGWDWACPADAGARRRLYGARLSALRSAGEPSWS